MLPTIKPTPLNRLIFRFSSRPSTDAPLSADALVWSKQNICTIIEHDGNYTTLCTVPSCCCEEALEFGLSIFVVLNRTSRTSLSVAGSRLLRTRPASH